MKLISMPEGVSRWAPRALGRTACYCCVPPSLPLGAGAAMALLYAAVQTNAGWPQRAYGHAERPSLQHADGAWRCPTGDWGGPGRHAGSAAARDWRVGRYNRAGRVCRCGSAPFRRRMLLGLGLVLAGVWCGFAALRVGGGATPSDFGRVCCHFPQQEVGGRVWRRSHCLRRR